MEPCTADADNAGRRRGLIRFVVARADQPVASELAAYRRPLLIYGATARGKVAAGLMRLLGHIFARIESCGVTGFGFDLQMNAAQAAAGAAAPFGAFSVVGMAVHDSFSLLVNAGNLR